jgi:hypothetical protein
MRHLFKRYREYLKNNPEHYWFKRKIYGWGWTPATWQGWLTLAGFFAVFLFIFVPFVSNPEPTNSMVVWFLVKITVWSTLLVLASYLTGKPPKWQWGFPQDKEKNG